MASTTEFVSFFLLSNILSTVSLKYFDKLKVLNQDQNTQKKPIKLVRYTKDIKNHLATI